MPGCVLLVDNDAVFLAIVRDYLESAGFQIILAESAAEAHRALETGRVHLMVIDVRLREDSDDQDRTGIRLAKDVARWLPKIVLTRWTVHRDVRDTMKLGADGRPAAIDFINKEDGLEVLRDAIRQAFRDHVRLNWDLTIELGRPRPLGLSQIAALIDPDARDEGLLNRTAELQELFRRLFWQWEQIRIERLIWSRGRRAAIAVISFAEGRPAQSTMVVCGPPEQVIEEAEAFRQHAPPPGGSMNTTLGNSVQSMHFAANVYDLAGADLENVRTLADSFRDGTEKAIKTNVVTLFRKTIPSWHRSQFVRATAPQSQLLRERLERLGEWLAEGQVRTQIEWLMSQLFRLGLKAERALSGYTLQFRNKIISYPDPVCYVTARRGDDEVGTLLNCPGLLSGENVLFDSSGGAWLTDFLGAGLAPAASSFVSLECGLRFELNGSADLHRLHDFEEILISAPFAQYNLSDLEGPLRKTGRAIQEIRRQAEQTLGPATDAYHEAVLFEAVSRLRGIPSAGGVTNSQLARFAHSWISALMICKVLGKPRAVRREETREATRARGGMCLDKKNGVIWIDGTKVDLGGIGLQLISVLYEHSNSLCTRRLLIEKAFGEDYQQFDTAQVARLNVAIRRLREKIEADPDNPRYLRTAHGGGYRLVVDPPPRP